MKKLLKSYQRKLTNLSSRNKSLVFLKPSPLQDIDLSSLHYIDHQPAFHIIEQLIAKKSKISLCPLVDSRNKAINEISNALRKISNYEKLVFEERGTRDLHIGWPFIEGKFVDGKIIRCPLLFFPVQLVQDNKSWQLLMDSESQITFNKSFLLAYSHFNNQPLNLKLEEYALEDLDTDSQVFRTQLYELLKDSGLDINFNQELFTNVLKSFLPMTKASFEENQIVGGIKLQPYAILGIFQQAGSYLYEDFDKLLGYDSLEDIENFFIESSDATNNHKTNREEHFFAPFDMDSSQEAAINIIKNGRSLVIQGPPGTGKSQVICNIVSDFIARGKKVLIVCEKKAALDVVGARMKDIGVENFIATIHDFKNERKIIFDQIATQVENIEEYKNINNSLDSIYIERKFIACSRKIDKIIEELTNFKLALFDDADCGYSAKDLYLTTHVDEESISFRNSFKLFKREEIETFPSKIRRWHHYAQQIGNQDHPWFDRKTFQNTTQKDKQFIVDVIESIPLTLNEINTKLKELQLPALTLDQSEDITNKELEIISLLELLSNSETYKAFQEIRVTKINIQKLGKFEARIKNCFQGQGIESSLKFTELNGILIILNKGILAKKSPIKWFVWKYLSKEYGILSRIIKSNGLTFHSAGLNILQEKIQNRIQYEKLLNEVSVLKGVKEFPQTFNYKSIEDWFLSQNKANEALEIVNNRKYLYKSIAFETTTYSELKARLQNLLEILRPLPILRKQWTKYLTEKQVDRIVVDQQYHHTLSKSLVTDFDLLLEFDKYLASLRSEEIVILEKLWNQCTSKTLDSLIKLFDNSIRLEWLYFLEEKYPILSIPSNRSIELLESELTEELEIKKNICKDILLMRLREQCYKLTTFNRLNNRITYRELHHQVIKRKKIWPLRKVFSSFHDELFKLIPCWLASPESVSAVFPMEKIFDLVIFDEASQCFAERAIPAIYRASQIIITGDNKQLAPSDLYQARWEEDNEEYTDLELDSILSLGEKHLECTTLTGHYRSRSPELIEFSNKQFYKGRLQCIPEYNHFINSEPAIIYSKVAGVWNNGVNIEEAEKVVELTVKLINEQKTSIGLVCFNYKQAWLIQELLERKLSEIEVKLPSDIFIKNIENVQGDEREIIIFSIGYAPDSKGKFAMNFGILNAINGENRLNVAITRARDKIIIISSILPSQLNVDSSLNEGPKLLKSYLKYAVEVSQGNFRYVDEQLNLKSTNSLSHQISNKSQLLEFKTRLPFGDITVETNNKTIGLVLTDDEKYYSSNTLKDPHSYQTTNLNLKHWKFKRVYSRNYWKDKKKFQSDLVSFFLDK